jgi:hypothetical protein
VKVHITGNVRHDGEDYTEGQEVILPDFQGEILIDLGEAEKLSDEQPEKEEILFDIYSASKKELNIYAKSIGIDPKAFPVRSELIEAIKNVQDGKISTK